jgi:hypothetical protein
LSSTFISKATLFCIFILVTDLQYYIFFLKGRLKIPDCISNNIKDPFLELREILFEHIVPSAAAEAPLQHPLPCPCHHKQWQIAPRSDN